ncbi:MULTISPECIES: S46 family peptidase [unclassified Muribaculum]|uniref:S46 family peptidase n=1 Tax=unclassified Muribaculum TaxID=2622126 RepID=UPI001EF3DD33|nr:MULTISPECIES: S46 family peptidase [unclassified Muribaculum]
MIKKLSISIAALALAFTPAIADEGMWLLPLLKKMNIGTMQEMGLELSAEDIYSINNTSLKDAIVQFGGGCTGEIISPNGLLVTNHHCGYSSIQKLSSVEHDYLNNGYWAMNLDEELPCEGLTVTFVESMTDVTKDIEKARKTAAKKGMDADSTVQAAIDRLVGKAVAENPHCDARVKSFYNNNAYYLIVTKTFKDIRFVGAPPSSIGKFGADTDNWMWPRHTGDFSMFRVYADKDNNPAEYSEDNVPFTPKRHLAISLKGIQEGDYTMIIGFPGTTNRYMAASELEMTRDINNAISIYVRGERQKIIMEDMLADPKVKIQYASKYAGSSNGWKKWIGMNESFAKLGIIERKKAEEAEFTEWVNAKQSRKEAYGKALEKINSAVAQMSGANYVYRYFMETIGQIELVQIASIAGAGAPQEAIDNFFKDYSLSTDKKVAERMIEIYKDNVDTTYWLPIFNEYGTEELVNRMYSESCFTSPEKIAAADKETVKNDIATRIVSELQTTIIPVVAQIDDVYDQYYEGKKEYTAGLLEMKNGEPIYPDANLTMRLTYGSVKSYSPRDAVLYNYYTTLDGVMEKEDPDNWEFVVPEKLKELYDAKDFGRYAMEVNGETKMPVAFISNNDITGGNSGSPIMNSKGELIGLAFDGNWEAMSGDIIFEPELQRCINVDIRYVLFIVDKFGGAGYLLDEMTIVE